MSGMKKVLGHHWTTHSAIVVVLFLALGGLFGLARGGRGVGITTDRLIGILLSAVGAAAVVIIGFYLFID
jgi:hypothetical protein